MTRRRSDLMGEVISSVCFEWPRCSCGTRWDFWGRAIRDGLPTLSPDEADGVRLSLACMLACVAEHCPNQRIRNHAQVQLLNPIWEAPL